MRIVDIDGLRPHFDMDAIVAVTRAALIAHAEGKVQSPQPTQLLFPDSNGDCHVKCGEIKGSDRFVIKVATGFYGNAHLGLPTNHGLLLLMNATTGQPEYVLKDDGWLTAWRTAASTALAAQAIRPDQITALGICGTGLQARLAAEWISHVLGPLPIFIWGREEAKRGECSAYLQALTGAKVHSTDSVVSLLQSCNLVVTATPSAAALFAAEHVNPGTRIVAVGADSPGKQELPSELFLKAAHILADDCVQSADHGDFCHAVRAGYFRSTDVQMIGNVLSGKMKLNAQARDVIIVDLTGIAAEDAAIAALFCGKLVDTQT